MNVYTYLPNSTASHLRKILIEWSLVFRWSALCSSENLRGSPKDKSKKKKISEFPEIILSMLKSKIRGFSFFIFITNVPIVFCLDHV